MEAEAGRKENREWDKGNGTKGRKRGRGCWWEGRTGRMMVVIATQVCDLCADLAGKLLLSARK